MQRTDLHHELNKQTGKLTWCELERYYARGVLIKTHASLDLINVASAFQQDKTAVIQQWLNEEKITHVSLIDAKLWASSTPIFWSIVVAPWVIIQKTQ